MSEADHFSASAGASAGPGWIATLNAYRLDAAAHVITPAASAWLNALRAFLLAEVVLGHLAAIALPEVPQLDGYDEGFAAFVVVYRLVTRFGTQSAFLFVFLSGYFVGGPLLTEAIERASPAFGAFARRRLTRIAPALWLALSLGAAFDLLGVHLFGVAEIYARQKSYDFLRAMTFENFIGDIFCLQPTFVGMFGSNGPLWTLGYIVQFYIAGFLLCFSLARRARAPLSVVLGIWAGTVLVRPEWAALFAIWTLGAAARNFSLGAGAERYGLLLGAALFVLANRLPTLPSILLCGAAGVGLVSWFGRVSFEPPAFLRCITSPIAERSYEAYSIHYPAAIFLFAVMFRHPAVTIAHFVSFLAASLFFIGLCAIAVERGAKSISSYVLLRK